MKLRANEIKRRAEEAGVTVAQLADAIERTGLVGDRAASAIRNWLGGRDHPRAKKADIARMADVLGCDAKDIVRFTSRIRGHRGSPKKAKLVVDLIRGKAVEDALNELAFTHKRASVNIKSALDAAIADAEQNDADVTRLFVSESRVDKGMHIKRFRPKDRGRAHPILKRTSHITVSVEERG